MILLSLVAAAAVPHAWARNDPARPQPQIAAPAHPTLGRRPPKDGIRLFDGHSLDAWDVHPGDGWAMSDGVFGPGAVRTLLKTKASFGDIELHLEFQEPATAIGEGQHRGNSGIFLMGVYEIQIMNPVNNPTFADGLIGAVYAQTPPRVVAARPPGEWQSFDIVFHAPRFVGGRIVRQPDVTVRLNGVLVQDRVTILGDTSVPGPPAHSLRTDTAPLALQGHGDPGGLVKFRNIWVRPLAAIRGA